jgi:hypothetical protein
MLIDCVFRLFKTYTFVVFVREQSREHISQNRAGRERERLEFNPPNPERLRENHPMTKRPSQRGKDTIQTPTKQPTNKQRIN